jgi:hypothetical protein
MRINLKKEIIIERDQNEIQFHSKGIKIAEIQLIKHSSKCILNFTDD